MKISNFEVTIKNTITKTTGIEEGLEVSNKNTIIESFK
tara:strand:- start:462 stop:575 length:114 start_codon:yes stop_codon:yes gene_type:complete